jgi:hypothetical protein
VPRCGLFAAIPHAGIQEKVESWRGKSRKEKGKSFFKVLSCESVCFNLKARKKGDKPT